MPARLKRDKRRGSKISDEAVEIFNRARSMASIDRERWEEGGGRRRDYLDTWKALHLALGLRLFEASPLDVNESDSAPFGGQCWTASVPKALALRAELIRLGGGHQN